MTMTPAELSSRHWDACVVGDGASALWTAHGLHASGKSVLWITNEEPGSVARLLAKHGWIWNMPPAAATELRSLLGIEGGFDEPAPFEAVYYDAKSSKRFKALKNAKVDWGDHEVPWLPSLFEDAGGENAPVDATAAHRLIWRRYAALEGVTACDAGTPSALFEVSAEPAFVIARSFLVIGLKSEEGRVSAIELATTGSKKTFELKADAFVLGDRGVEHLPEEAHKAAVKGRSYRAGFSLEFRHKAGCPILEQTAIVPLVVNPSKKGLGSHVVGRFIEGEGDIESAWFGLLTDEELEDNNEILKKIKSAKKAIDRALPGFLASIEHESFTFEPQMCARDLVKKRPGRVLEAALVTDLLGPAAAVKRVREVLSAASTP